jgi:outer membrane biosynthesis protein TonB
MVETTPRGTILLCYNYEIDGFEYWSDSDIPLTMLETAARRYVTEYNCKQFYLPRKKTNDVDKEDVEQQLESETTSSTEPAPAQKSETTPTPTPEPEPEDDVFIKRKKTDTQLKLEKQIAEEEPVTRFIKKGKLVDFKPKELFKGMNFDEQVTKKTLNYDTFKKAMMESMSASTPSRTDYASIRNASDAGMF